MDTLDRDRHHRAAATLPRRHVCVVTDSADEQRGWLADWTREGLAAGERVVTVEPVQHRGTYLRMLDDAGLAWRDAASAGQLLVLPPEDVYLTGDGAFDPDRRIAEHAAFVEASLRDGYPAVRLTGEAMEALAVMPGPDGLLEYEALLDDLCLTHPLSGLCLYARGDFASLMGRIAGAHPRAVVDRQLHGCTEPGVVAIAGELDLSNIALLRALLDCAAPRDGVLTIDAGGCTFIDVANTGEIVALARRLRPHATVQVLDPPPQLDSILDCVGWRSEIQVLMRGATR